MEMEAANGHAIAGLLRPIGEAMTLRRRYLSPKEKLAVRARQNHKCVCGCGEPLAMGGVQYDHIIPLHLDGTNDIDNFQALNPKHHGKKSVKELKARAKVKRIQAQGGLLRKKKSHADKAMEKIWEKRT